jgi:hypothetical protein
MPLSSSYVWFVQGLNVINAVLDLHRDSLRLRPLLSRAEEVLEGCNLVVAVVDDLVPSRPVDYVTIRLQQGRFVLVAHARTTPRTDWRVYKSELIDVARNPRPYLDNPDQLDLNWLEKRVARSGSRNAAAESPLSIGAMGR